PPWLGQIFPGSRSRDVVRGGPAGGPLQPPPRRCQSDNLCSRHWAARGRHGRRGFGRPETEKVCDSGRRASPAHERSLHGSAKLQSARPSTAADDPIAAVGIDRSPVLWRERRQEGAILFGGAEELPKQR